PAPLDLYTRAYEGAATPETYTLSLHDALTIFGDDSGRDCENRGAVRADAQAHVPGRVASDGLVRLAGARLSRSRAARARARTARSEEYTSERQSRENLVCRLLLEKKNDTKSDP